MQLPWKRGDAFPSVERVLVGTDRSETAERAVQWALDMAERYEAELLVLQVLLDAAVDAGAVKT
ncbi:MAG: universal stress protein, partial [Actinomycetota bacterium]|nr:universal stress protein [Actinomycetota bacterium]